MSNKLKSKDNLPRCSERVYSDGFMRGHQCSRKGRYLVNGAYWCKQHNPDFIKIQEEERKRKWSAQSKLRDLRREQSKMLGLFAEALSDIAPTHPLVSKWKRLESEITAISNQLEQT